MAEEIERRVEEIDSGRAELIPWEEIKAKLIAREREAENADHPDY